MVKFALVVYMSDPRSKAHCIDCSAATWSVHQGLGSSCSLGSLHYQAFNVLNEFATLPGHRCSTWPSPCSTSSLSYLAPDPSDLVNYALVLNGFAALLGSLCQRALRRTGVIDDGFAALPGRHRAQRVRYATWSSTTSCSTGLLHYVAIYVNVLYEGLVSLCSTSLLHCLLFSASGVNEGTCQLYASGSFSVPNAVVSASDSGK